jgi:hypothetical protein
LRIAGHGDGNQQSNTADPVEHEKI